MRVFYILYVRSPLMMRGNDTNMLKTLFLVYYYLLRLYIRTWMQGKLPKQKTYTKPAIS